jgi:transcriptional regulator NrdR family protein
MGKQLGSNNRNLNFSMLNGIKESLKNSGHHSNIEEQRIDELISKVKIKYLGIDTKWINSLDIPEIEKRFAKSVKKFIENKNSKNTNFSNLELQEILKKTQKYSNIEKSRMTELISKAKNQVIDNRSMYN